MELLQIATAEFITKCNGQLLQIASAFLLQSATRFITSCDRYCKVRWVYYKLRQDSSTLFLYISLPLFSMTTTRNFQKPFYGGNVVRVLIHFFFTAAHFLLALVAASISHFVTTATKFSRCSSNKKFLLCFSSLTLDLCRPFSRWVSLAFRVLSHFLCLSLAICSKFVDMTINLSLIL